jgi:hypothetical protein
MTEEPTKYAGDTLREFKISVLESDIEEAEKYINSIRSADLPEAVYAVLARVVNCSKKFIN